MEAMTMIRRLFYKVFKLLAIITLSSGLVACAGKKPCANDSVAEDGKTRIRDVRTVVLSEGSSDRNEIKKLVEEASEDFFEQTGIRLVVTDWKTLKWNGSSRVDVLQQVSEEMKGYGKPYDMAIGFYDMNPFQSLTFNMFGGWAGVIDDVYRRFIVVRRDQPFVLVHELGHAYLFQHAHSAGVMNAYDICLLGDHLCTNSSICFMDQDRQEIEANKWRDFSVMPNLAERQDLIKGYSFIKTPPRVLYDFITIPFAEY